MKHTPVTLCFLLRDAGNGTEVLLGLKRTGFGTGKIVGLGGHVEIRFWQAGLLEHHPDGLVDLCPCEEFPIFELAHLCVIRAE